MLFLYRILPDLILILNSQFSILNSKAEIASYRRNDILSETGFVGG